ncbi:hypothetical protein PAMC26510_22925 [Caballeronia sordidicola]|uniref:Uncharacterized protein n=1 Tax=Caballeronia sordidicola TaxID=196367 RepID=A0A242MKI9_CABSO|nr:hypothetical protein PAMC26577_22925 [Caballeronia sordidicola]OTP72018.1 hypothetical protein PAMC26510_22925 [Caballeronia sordidicola]
MISGWRSFKPGRKINWRDVLERGIDNFQIDAFMSQREFEMAYGRVVD